MKLKNEEYRKKKCKQMEREAKRDTLCIVLSYKLHQFCRHPETGEKLHWEYYSAEVRKEG